MARAWGSREPNSFEVECAYCHTTFWTTSGVRKYCSDLCLKQATKKNTQAKRDQKRPARVAQARRRKQESPVKQAYNNRWDLSGGDEGSVAYFYNRDIANVHVSEDIDNIRVETDLDDILSLFKSGIVYGKFAELRSTANPFKLMVASLNQAIDGVSPRRVAEMIKSITRQPSLSTVLSKKRNPPEVEGEERWHGTVSGYKNHKCRCDACSEANTTYQREYRRKTARKKEPDVPD